MKKLYKRCPALFSIILCFALVLCSAAVYFGIGLLPGRARICDVSPNKLYTLHTETEKLLSELDRDVTVLLISTTGIPEYGTPEAILRSYAEENEHVKLHVISPSEAPEQYGTLTEGCAVIRSNLRETVVYSSDYFDMSEAYFEFSYDYYYYLTSSMGYDFGSYYDFMYSGYGESLGLFDIAKYQPTLTGAIRYVAEEEVTTLYAVTDHGETTLDTYLYPLLRDNMTELEFGKLSDGIPGYVDGILINDPTSDISESDKGIISEYLADGGKMTLMTSFTNIKSLTNLRAVCEEYGLTTDGGLLCEDKEGAYFSVNYDAPLPTVNVEAFGEYLKGEYKPVWVDGTGIVIAEKSGVTAVSLLNTSSEAYTKQEVVDASSLKFNAETDARKQYSTAALASKSENGSSVMWLSSFALNDSVCDTASSRNNFSVFTAALGVQYGTNLPVDISGVPMSQDPLQASTTAFAIGMVIAIIVPCVVIVVGVTVVIKRRKPQNVLNSK